MTKLHTYIIQEMTSIEEEKLHRPKKTYLQMHNTPMERN